MQEFFLEQGFSSDWKTNINEILNLVPDVARPTVICNFSNFKKVTGRKDIIPSRADSKYGVTISMPDITLPISYFSDEFKDWYKSKGMFNERLYEVKPDFTLMGQMVNKSINVVAFNAKDYKTLNDITTRKEQVDDLYFKAKDRYYFFNKTGRLTIFHEFGHVYDNRKYISNKMDWKFLCIKWYAESKIDILKNEREAFPEAFADYFGNEGKKLPDYIYEYFKLNIK